MPTVFLGVGSNLGSRKKNLDLGRQCLANIQGIKVLRTSLVRETDPVGGPPQGKYLNAVWEIETELAPEELLLKLHTVEKKCGRERREPNAPRTLDLDILFYGDQIVQKPRLEIPHPHLAERTFVLEPLAELTPDWIHPVLRKSVRELLEAVLERNSKP